MCLELARNCPEYPLGMGWKKVFAQIQHKAELPQVTFENHVTRCEYIFSPLVLAEPDG